MLIQIGRPSRGPPGGGHLAWAQEPPWALTSLGRERALVRGRDRARKAKAAIEACPTAEARRAMDRRPGEGQALE